MRNVFIALTLCVAFVSCKTQQKGEPVATVDGEAIYKADFDAEVERNMARYRGHSQTMPPGIEVRIKESVLRRMIDDKVVELRAKKEGVAVTDEELQSKFDEYKARFRTEQAFADYLQRSKNTVENMKSDLRRNLLRDRLVTKLSGDTGVSDEEIQKYYEDNKRRFIEKEQVKASRILARVPRDAKPADRKKAMRKAQDLARKAKSGDFVALAKEHSEAPEASRGGDLGWLSRGRMPPEFDNAAFALKAGDISKPVETKLGYEVIKVWEKKEERERPLSEVSESIKNSLTARRKNEKRRDVLRELKTAAKIEQLIKFERPTPQRAADPKLPPTHPTMKDALKKRLPPQQMGGLPNTAPAAQPADKTKAVDPKGTEEGSDEG